MPMFRKKVPLKGPLKLVAGFVAILAATYFGYQAYAGLTVDRMTFDTLRPGRVNLIAVDPGSGYGVLVSNGIAHLAQIGDRQFGAAEDVEQRAVQAEGKRRLPLREMLGALQGDEEALSVFVMRVNRITDQDLPTVRIYWDAADVRRALDGDRDLRARLEADLGIGLDGTPRSEVTISALESGIVLRVPVTVHVGAGETSRTMTATVLRPFQPGLLALVRSQYERRPAVDNELIANLYKAEALRVLADPGLRENVAESLRQMIDPQRSQAFARDPERVLASAKVVLNERHIRSAGYHMVENPNGRPTYSLTMGLTDEGRLRLWKQSRDQRGFMLMLVVDGVAIAAPRITHELVQSHVTMSKLPDERLVRDAVRIMLQREPLGEHQG
jgi:hypothetical protein